jgi:hypothetical protein
MNTATIVSLVAMLLTAIASALTGTLASFWAAHSDLALIVATIWGALGHFLPAVMPSLTGGNKPAGS